MMKTLVFLLAFAGGALAGSNNSRSQRWAKSEARDRRAARVVKAATGGTGGGGGSSCTNYAETINAVTFSQALDDASWLLLGTGGVVAPVVTANAATAPACNTVGDATGCGAATADEFLFASTVGAPAGYSFVASLTGCTGAVCTDAIYLKSKTTSGEIDLLGNGGVPKVQCAHNPTTWTRCDTGVFDSGGAGVFAFGNHSGIERAAQDVYVWQADSTNIATVSPPIPTTTDPVTRAAGCY